MATMAPLLEKKVRRPDRENLSCQRTRSQEKSSWMTTGTLHGTNAPGSIGTNASHGCVRMLPKDARQVADLIKEQVGTTAQPRESENGSYVVLRSPVILTIVN